MCSAGVIHLHHVGSAAEHRARAEASMTLGTVSKTIVSSHAAVAQRLNHALLSWQGCVSGVPRARSNPVKAANGSTASVGGRMHGAS